jgi:steroid delta-isomerase-like uncharacterized protein
VLSESRRAARIQVVEDHIRHENAHELKPLVATFGGSPEWHSMPTGEVFSTHADIHGFYAALFTGFPDFWLEIRARHISDQAVVIEGDLGGTHRGEWAGLGPTGRSARVPFCAVFTFDDDDRLKAEIVYFDRLSLLTQLGVMGSS